MSDERIAALEVGFRQLEKKLDENTAKTQEVLDTLRAFKMIGTIAKWGTVVGGALVGAYHGMQAMISSIRGG